MQTVNKNMTGDIVVVLRGGMYTLDQTLVFDPTDSGIGGHNVIYRAAKNETPVLSGGRKVTGWQQDEKGRWKATSPVELFRQLYVNGKRAVLARGKEPANLKYVGTDGYSTTDVQMADWKNPSDLEFCYLAVWAHVRCKVQSIKRDGDLAIIRMQQPYFTLAKEKEGVQIANPAHLKHTYLENRTRAAR